MHTVSDMTHRRTFLKNTAAVCCGSLLLGVSFTSCIKLPVIKTNVTNKSIRIDESDLVEGYRWIIRTKELDYDLLLVRQNAGGYHCLPMKCTHQDYPLTLAGNALVCNNHGSRFDLEGHVMKDPAIKSLQKFSVNKNQTQITITL